VRRAATLNLPISVTACTGIYFESVCLDCKLKITISPYLYACEAFAPALQNSDPVIVTLSRAISSKQSANSDFMKHYASIFQAFHDPPT
jgi:hypothetical protein